MDLMEFLRARLDEDERAAKDASPDGGREHAAYVLADVASKRRIVDMHTPITLSRMVDGEIRAVTACDYDTDPDGAEWMDYPCATLRLLALPYAGHPDYRDEWRPT